MKKIAIITCGSFTAIMLLFAVFSHLGLNFFVPMINDITVVQSFVISFSISVLMALWEKLAGVLDSSSLAAELLIRILICYLVVFVEGGLFGMIPFSWTSLLLISPVLLLTYLITLGLSYLICAEWADNINRSIRRKSKTGCQTSGRAKAGIPPQRKKEGSN